jgi:histone deacetylase complex regulatory component SIN3
VAVLFKNHHDLLTEFTYFLPDSSPPAGVRACSSSAAASQPNRHDQQLLMWAAGMQLQ